MIDTDPAIFEGGRKLPLVEDFYTIQGEGFHAGKPAYFIRLGGCDVGCRWCDAKYTWNARRYPPVDVQVVIDRALACPACVSATSTPTTISWTCSTAAR